MPSNTLSMDKKIYVSFGERVKWEKAHMPEEVQEVIAELQQKLLEQDMILSIFQSINGVSGDIYRTVKEDYRKAFNECSKTKEKVSAIVLGRYTTENNEGLSWTYSAIDDSLTIYTTK